MSRGHLSLVLHAHQPFVRHPEHEDFLEEGWLREAILETYIPLLWELERLADEGFPYRITLSFSPTLVAMLDDPLLRTRFSRRMDHLCELADREVYRTRHLPQFHETARLYQARFARVQRDYHDHWRKDLVGAFRRLATSGRVELITCAATHGYLPLLSQNPQAVRAQVLVALSHHERSFGSPSPGFWIPECGYYAGLDAILKQAGVAYSFVETHAIDHATDRPYYGVFAPLRSPSGVSFFGRDPTSTKQVWSATEGYPAHPDYREYYRDVGFDLDADALGACAHPLGIRRNVGIKYYRVTGRTDAKEPYVHAWAEARASEHAADFCFNRRRQVEWLADHMARDPVIVAPYDAELFGHWWFEGPQWLGLVLKNLAHDSQILGLRTPFEYLSEHPANQLATPSASSWGYKGYSEMWLNGSNDWIYPHLHQAADTMIDLADAHPHAQGSLLAALNQAARELLLAQASDWAFIMTTGTVVPYAVRRTKEHLLRFQLLANMVTSGRVDQAKLDEIAAQDNLFPHIDYRVYRTDYDVTKLAEVPTLSFS